MISTNHPPVDLLWDLESSLLQLIAAVDTFEPREGLYPNALRCRSQMAQCYGCV